MKKQLNEKEHNIALDAHFYDLFSNDWNLLANGSSVRSHRGSSNSRSMSLLYSDYIFIDSSWVWASTDQTVSGTGCRKPHSNHVLHHELTTIGNIKNMNQKHSPKIAFCETGAIMEQLQILLPLAIKSYKHYHQEKINLLWLLLMMHMAQCRGMKIYSSLNYLDLHLVTKIARAFVNKTIQWPK